MAGTSCLPPLCGLGAAPPAYFVPDAMALLCQSCGTSFSLLMRRHHCRCCGGVFCDVCSGRRTAVPGWGYEDPVRVCDECFTLEEQQLPVLRRTMQLVSGTPPEAAAWKELVSLLRGVMGRLQVDAATVQSLLQESFSAAPSEQCAACAAHLVQNNANDQTFVAVMCGFAEEFRFL